MSGKLPDVHFGSPAAEKADWRKRGQGDSPDDDEELAKTPADVITLLGFDPLDLEAE